MAGQSLPGSILQSLEASGYAVEVAISGEEAWARLCGTGIDVAVIDLFAPEMDGAMLLHRIAGSRQQLPTVLLLEPGTSEAMTNALRLGSWKYLEKPITEFDLLRRAIRSVLEKSAESATTQNVPQRLEVEAITEGREKEAAQKTVANRQGIRCKAGWEWESTMDLLPDPLALYTRDHRIIRLNHAMATALGVAADKAVGERFCLVQGCRGEIDDICPHAILMQGQTPRITEIYCERTGLYYEIKVHPVARSEDESVAGSVLHARDVTERVVSQKKVAELRARLLQAQKLESVGRLASGIAHEINTPAQYVASNIDFLAEAFRDIDSLVGSLQEDPQLRDGLAGERLRQLLVDADWDFLQNEIPTAIKQSREGVGRVSSIVRAMKEFSHPGSKEKQVTSLNKIVEMTVTVARNEWKYAAEMRLDLDPDLPPVSCFTDEIGQVVLNLIVNAAHAISAKYGRTPEMEKGMITISTRSQGDEAVLEVADTGDGIPEEIRTKIFKPFFTTKEAGQGTGQGLAIAYEVIRKKHGGTITVDSTVGEGATFTIRLPVHTQ